MTYQIRFLDGPLEGQLNRYARPLGLSLRHPMAGPTAFSIVELIYVPSDAHPTETTAIPVPAWVNDLPLSADTRILVAIAYSERVETWRLTPESLQQWQELQSQDRRYSNSAAFPPSFTRGGYTFVTEAQHIAQQQGVDPAPSLTNSQALAQERARIQAAGNQSGRSSSAWSAVFEEESARRYRGASFSIPVRTRT
jgi:hypothetical protein